MKKLLYILSLSVGLTMVMSFMPKPINLVGIYTLAPSNPSQMKLNLQYDHTFMYQDFTNAKSKITVYGRWAENGNVVLLKDYVATFKFNEKCQITPDGKSAKARIGTTIYTLRKQDGC